MTSPSAKTQEELERSVAAAIMVRSLGFQLGQKFDVVRECLIDLEEETAAKALVDPDVAVNALLVKPLKKLAKIQKHAVILLDALDEADDDRHISNAAVGLLRHLARDVRSSVSVLVTTRPDADGDYPRRRVLEHDWEGGMRVMEPAHVLGQAPVEVEKEESRLPGPWEEAMPLLRLYLRRIPISPLIVDPVREAARPVPQGSFSATTHARL